MSAGGAAVKDLDCGEFTFAASEDSPADMDLIHVGCGKRVTSVEYGDDLFVLVTFTDDHKMFCDK